MAPSKIEIKKKEEELQAPAPVKRKKKSKKSIRITETVNISYPPMKVFIPAGGPPFAPAGLPNPSEKQLLDWANKVREHSPLGVLYTSTALIYWCRSFWNVFSDEYNYAKSVLTPEFKEF